MSRGFVREDDQEEAPFVPPRAALPAGVPNHVTPRGLELLLAERVSLEAERSAVSGSDDERRRENAVIDGRLDLLNERIATARVVEKAPGPQREVRFGNSVRFRYKNGPQEGAERTFTIVGVDEASLAELRIAFVAPVARALIGKRIGDLAEFQLGAQVQQLEVVGIS
ncbi:MAG TPA: GreA/GreB family elongation factor [Flavobacteriales bacterium]|nr:GreA/GreB family elongation factor [Flavobacteriales bacterium]